MTREEAFTMLRSVMSEVFYIHENHIKITSDRQNLQEWDSLAHLRLCMSIEQKFGLNLDFEEIAKLDSVENILNIMVCN